MEPPRQKGRLSEVILGLLRFCFLILFKTLIHLLFHSIYLRFSLFLLIFSIPEVIFVDHFLGYFGHVLFFLRCLKL